MLTILRAVASKTLGRDFELARAVPKGQEAQDRQQETNGLGRDILDGSDVDGLTVVAEPVTEIDTADVKLETILCQRNVRSLWYGLRWTARERQDNRPCQSSPRRRRGP